MQHLLEQQKLALIEELEQLFDHNPDDILCCLHCLTPLTRRSFSISIQQYHSHQFTNPGGFVYNIGCYHSAPGCLISGIPEDAFSWFPGYQWQFAHCEHCQDHLGWYYTPRHGRATPGSSFFGLISAKLVAPEA